MSRGLAKLKVKDLPQITLLIPSCTPVLKKIFLRLMIERYEAEIKLVKSQEQTQDLDNEQDMYDALKPMEDEEENDQELPDCLPMSCVMLIREYQDLIAMEKRECCLEETSEDPQDFPASTTEDILEEVQEEILPPNHLLQETKSCCPSAQRNTRQSSPLTKEAIDQILNQ